MPCAHNCKSPPWRAEGLTAHRQTPELRVFGGGYTPSTSSVAVPCAPLLAQRYISSSRIDMRISPPSPVPSCQDHVSILPSPSPPMSPSPNPLPSPPTPPSQHQSPQHQSPLLVCAQPHALPRPVHHPGERTGTLPITKLLNYGFLAVGTPQAPPLWLHPATAFACLRNDLLLAD